MPCIPTILPPRHNKREHPNPGLLSSLLAEAADLLRGEGLEPVEAEEARERLLSGYRWILVDEYQDINGRQYELILRFPPNRGGMLLEERKSYARDETKL